MEYKIIGDYNRTHEKMLSDLPITLEHMSKDGWEFVSEVTRWMQGQPSYYLVFKRTKDTQ